MFSEECFQQVIPNVGRLLFRLFYRLALIKRKPLSDVVENPDLAAQLRETLVSLDVGLVGQVLRTGQGAVIDDVRAVPSYYELLPGTRSELVVPLLDNARVLGVLDLDSPVPGRFDDVDRAGCERLVALFLENQLRWPEGFA